MTAETRFDLAPQDVFIEALDTDLSEVPPEVDAASCEVGVSWMSPIHQSEHILLDSELKLAFTVPLPEDAVWSFEILGIPGDAVLSDDRTHALLTPKVKLQHRQQYVIAASVCDTYLEQSFTVAPPPVPPDNVDQAAWIIPFSELTWLQPSSAAIFMPTVALDATILETYLDQRGNGPQGLRMRVVPAEWNGTSARPLACEFPTDLGEVDLSANPLFSTEPIVLRYPIGGIELSSPDTQILGVLEEHGDRLIDLEFIGLIDVRALEDVLSEDEICSISANLGEPCRPCPDGVIACLDAVAVIDEAIPLQRPLDEQLQDVAATSYCP
jgi:hypothetical protein